MTVELEQLIYRLEQMARNIRSFPASDDGYDTDPRTSDQILDAAAIALRTIAPNPAPVTGAGNDAAEITRLNARLDRAEETTVTLDGGVAVMVPQSVADAIADLSRRLGEAETDREYWSQAAARADWDLKTVGKLLVATEHERDTAEAALRDAREKTLAEVSAWLTAKASEAYAQRPHTNVKEHAFLSNLAEAVRALPDHPKEA